MKFGIIAAFATMVLSAFAGSAGFKIDELHWLAGPWEFEKNGRTVREEWMPPAGGTMLGMSRTVKAGRTVVHEFLLLRTDDAGEIYYVASPSSQATTSFKLVRLEPRLAVFENPEHDFPQRIGYELSEDGSLLAYIEGPGRDGTTKRIEFPYRRVE